MNGRSTEISLRELVSYNRVNILAADCHSILITQANIHHFKAKIPMGLEQTITLPKASHSPKDSIPKGGAPD